MSKLENISKINKAIKSEHLIEGAKAIMACVGIPEQFKLDPKDPHYHFENWKPFISKKNNVNYFRSSNELKELGFKNAGIDSYVISPVDNEDKFSMTFQNCLGVVAAGNSTDSSRENISFMSHQNPEYFIRDAGTNNRKIFFNDFEQSLNELNGKSISGTVDVVIFGGNYPKEKYDRKNYLDAIEVLSKKISDVFGFDPVIIVGPKIHNGEDDVFYNNKERKLHIIRPRKENFPTESFSASSLHKQKKKWVASKKSGYVD